GLPGLCLGCPAWSVHSRQEMPGEHIHQLTGLPLSRQVCNCDRYLKVSRERMKQLVASSRHTAGASSSGKRPTQSCDATVPACASARPGSTPHSTRPEGPEPHKAPVALAEGTVLQVSAIPPGVLDKADLTDFYCCTHCGKVFWEGSHFGRVVSQFQDVLVASGGTQSIYKLS
ncbi:MUT7 Exonuclease, partial [Centropus unirufus]|nr:MUT7 Exonuclease [Centropus unirufus]